MEQELGMWHGGSAAARLPLPQANTLESRFRSAYVRLQVLSALLLSQYGPAAHNCQGNSAGAFMPRACLWCLQPRALKLGKSIMHWSRDQVCRLHKSPFSHSSGRESVENKAVGHKLLPRIILPCCSRLMTRRRICSTAFFLDGQKFTQVSQSEVCLKADAAIETHLQ